MSLVVAIDGPAGSGKSTVAAALAERLGLPHVDTGAFYRAATLAVLHEGGDPADAASCAGIVARSDIRQAAGRTLLDGEDVEDEIRGPAVTAAVVEGRDAGTVVVPNAPLKVWLTASARDRAVRRAAQLGTADPDAVARHERDIARRDTLDAAQMARARDAIDLDTTGRSVEEIVALLEARARAVLQGR